jgi:hypothetical protein
MNPGIVRTVKWLNDNDFRTTDSGDGKTHDHLCDRDYSYVVIVVDGDGGLLVREVERLVYLLKVCGIKLDDLQENALAVQGTYIPYSEVPCVIDVSNIDDALLFPPEAP